MEDHYRMLINNSLPDLINVTSNVESIADKLFEKGVINEWMKKQICNPRLKTAEKKIKLYHSIQGRGPKAFSDLCKSLEETSNISARKILQASKGRVINREHSSNVLGTAMSNINLNNENNLLPEEPYVKIHPERRRMDIDSENLPIGAYHMGSNPKGHALILNINNVKYRKERRGSNVDVSNLLKLFGGLGYVVQSNIDLTEKEIRKIMKEFVDTCNIEKADSIVVFIMSHGEAGKDCTRSSDILSADGININTDWIIEQFEPGKITRIIPKLFFIQACRGENNDFGWNSSDYENNKLQNDNTYHSQIGNIINRRYENVFIAYATVPGYNAKRDPVNGSWFVQKLCEVFRENACYLDLHQLMKMVDVQIKELNNIEDGFQTVEWTYRGFNKRFFFNPGLNDEDEPKEKNNLIAKITT